MSSNEFGKIFKRAWGDPDFKKLTAGEQHLYFKLISQPDVSLAGVLTYAPTRWAMQTAGLSTEDIERDFSGLSRKRYAVVDLDTQEVLVRSYIRNDLGWRSPRTMIGIANAVGRVLSPVLRGVISRELTRLDTATLSSAINEKTNRSSREVVEAAIRGVLEQFPPLDTLSNALNARVSDTPSDTPSIGYLEGFPQFADYNSNGNSSSNGSSNGSSNSKECASAAAASPAPLPEMPSLESSFDEFWSKWPNSKGKKEARASFVKALKLTTLDTLVAAIPPMVAEYARKDWDVPMASTWLNQERWNDEYDTAGGGTSDESAWDIYSPQQEPEGFYDRGAK